MVSNKRNLERAFTPRKRRSGTFRPNSVLYKTTNSNIQVVVRVRPSNERDRGLRQIIKVIDDKMLVFDPEVEDEPFFVGGIKQNNRDMLKRRHKELNFIFDKVYGGNSSNQDVFEGTTKDLIKSLLDGYNCSVFVYGATGAGKTYTMLGNKDSPGISYLTMVELYYQIENMKMEKEFELGISYMEVYNENVQDLLNPSGPLHLRDDGNNGTVVAGIQMRRINSADELFSLLEQGNKNRTQHPTDANAESSRSHAVFQVFLRITNRFNSQIKLAKLVMIDLAGSERGAATGCKGIRFAEGSSINKSLLALGNCVNALADGLKHIPYRNSKLTRLIKDALGGNSKTVMIANVSPSCLSYEESYNTLNYATRAKKINSKLKNNIVNVDMHVSQYIKMVEDLRLQNTKLKQQLDEALRNRETPSKTSQSIPQGEFKPEQQEEARERLQTMFKFNSNCNREILKLDSEIKTLTWRIQHKKKIAKRLDAFGNEKDTARIDNQLHRLHGQMSSFQEKLMSTKRQMTINHGNIDHTLKELESKGLMGHLEQVIAENKYQVKIQESMMQVEHLQKLLVINDSEMKNEDNIIAILFPKLVQYYSLLDGYHKTTDAMRAEYEVIQRLLRGMKGVTWEDTPCEVDNLEWLTKLSLTNSISERDDLVYGDLITKDKMRDCTKKEVEEEEVELPEVPNEDEDSPLLTTCPGPEEVLLQTQNLKDSILLSSQLFQCNLLDEPSATHDFNTNSVVPKCEEAVPVNSYNKHFYKCPTLPSNNMEFNNIFKNSSIDTNNPQVYVLPSSTGVPTEHSLNSTFSDTNNPQVYVLPSSTGVPTEHSLKSTFSDTNNPQVYVLPSSTGVPTEHSLKSTFSDTNNPQVYVLPSSTGVPTEHSLKSTFSDTNNPQVYVLPSSTGVPTEHSLNRTFSLEDSNQVNLKLPVMDNKLITKKVLIERNASRVKSENILIKGASKAVCTSPTYYKNKPRKSPFLPEHREICNKENRFCGRPAIQSRFTFVKPNLRTPCLARSVRPQTRVIPGSMKFQQIRAPRFSPMHPYLRNGLPRQSEASTHGMPR